ncbi:unnamed protein product [Adineta steineri]|uniref:Nuclear receptor domain-containing protein n=1 Tax=Adineta steineri TaxID=433720 RepID=A0A818I8A0_9BILA|nr:unnamed protein product [Adineta steineri]
MNSSTNLKQRRVMLITTDEKIIDQICTSNNLSSSSKTVILESGENNNDLSDSSDDIESMNQEGISTTKLLICVICGSSATGRNFGVISCESCKLFFRRNALKNPATLSCRYKNTCTVTLETRRRCSACRLNKCLKYGMERERLIKAEKKSIERRQCREERTKVSPINEQNSQLQLLTSPDSYSPQTSSRIQRAILNSDDLQRIEIVQTAFEKRIELARDNLLWNPTVHSTNLLEFLNSRSVPAMRLVAFFKQIPEFTQLNPEDKFILTKYNLMPLLVPSFALSFKKDTKQVIETNTDIPWDESAFQQAIGTNYLLQIKPIFAALVEIVQYDQKIMQLFLIVLFLSKGLSTGEDITEPILRDYMAVYRAHNFYTELLWNYMEVTHGIKVAYRIFSKLIFQYLRWLNLRRTIALDVQQSLPRTEQSNIFPVMQSLFHI